MESLQTTVAWAPPTNPSPFFRLPRAGIHGEIRKHLVDEFWCVKRATGHPADFLLGTLPLSNSSSTCATYSPVSAFICFRRGETVASGLILLTGFGVVKDLSRNSSKHKDPRHQAVSFPLIYPPLPWELFKTRAIQRHVEFILLYL